MNESRHIRVPLKPKNVNGSPVPVQVGHMPFSPMFSYGVKVDLVNSFVGD
jgi:hypothetical protein